MRYAANLRESQILFVHYIYIQHWGKKNGIIVRERRIRRIITKEAALHLGEFQYGW